MSRVLTSVLALAGALAIVPAAQAQRPYIGFVYPAGGQQGTTFHVQLGGQVLDDVTGAVVSGGGVTVKLIEYHRRMSPQDTQLLSEQLRELRSGLKGPAAALVAASRKSRQSAPASSEMSMMDSPSTSAGPPLSGQDKATLALIEKIQRRVSNVVQRPACASLSSLAFFEVTVAPDAKPGEREIALVSRRGVSNPMAFHIGQLTEVSRKPMRTAEFQVLGKEELALRKRPDDEIEQAVTLPCTLNGQIASGEVNKHRFQARKGQRLVASSLARQLVPYIADAVPGWLQLVMTVHDAKGKEVAYADDYRFKPDPVLLFEVPEDGEYVLSVNDALFRGREDFVYRVYLGELPFVTSIFPLGGQVGAQATIQMKGWNLDKAQLVLPATDAVQGIHPISGRKGRLATNAVPFALDTLPECFERESNNEPKHAQQVMLPTIVNGRIDQADDWDVFQFSGRAGDTIVTEVTARRLDSPLDSLVKLTDAAGKLLAFNDDREDPMAGVNTHDADSYLMFTLPADGTYFVHIGDTARSGGEEYGYRLRIGPPRPDFALRVVPSSVAFRSKGFASLTVHVVRLDGFNGPVKLVLKDPPEGFLMTSAVISETQANRSVNLKTTLADTKQPLTITIQGHATIDGNEVVHDAVPAEDRMQAFLWRHLVPAQELKVKVYDPTYEPPAKRVRKPPTQAQIDAKIAEATTAAADGKFKFTKSQVTGRLRQLKILFEEGLTTPEFDQRKVLECEALR